MGYSINTRILMITDSPLSSSETKALVDYVNDWSKHGDTDIEIEPLGNGRLAFVFDDDVCSSFNFNKSLDGIQEISEKILAVVALSSLNIFTEQLALYASSFTNYDDVETLGNELASELRDTVSKAIEKEIRSFLV